MPSRSEAGAVCSTLARSALLITFAQRTDYKKERFAEDPQGRYASLNRSPSLTTLRIPAKYRWRGIPFQRPAENRHSPLTSTDFVAFLREIWLKKLKLTVLLHKKHKRNKTSFPFVLFVPFCG